MRTSAVRCQNPLAGIEVMWGATAVDAYAKYMDMRQNPLAGIEVMWGVCLRTSRRGGSRMSVRIPWRGLRSRGGSPHGPDGWPHHDAASESPGGD